MALVSGSLAGTRARVIDVERPPAAAPAEREVAVEVHAARVLARAVGDAVRVRRAHEQQPHAGRRQNPPQARDHRVARGLVAVDRAHDQHVVAAAGSPTRVTVIGRPSADRPNRSAATAVGAAAASTAQPQVSVMTASRSRSIAPQVWRTRSVLRSEGGRDSPWGPVAREDGRSPLPSGAWRVRSWWERGRSAPRSRGGSPARAPRSPSSTSSSPATRAPPRAASPASSAAAMGPTRTTRRRRGVRGSCGASSRRSPARSSSSSAG